MACRPKQGRAAELEVLIADHAPFLRRLGIATDRPSTLIRGADGVVINVFEWKEGAIARAHQHSDVLAMWGRYAEVCDYVPLHALPRGPDVVRAVSAVLGFMLVSWRINF